MFPNWTDQFLAEYRGSATATFPRHGFAAFVVGRQTRHGEEEEEEKRNGASTRDAPGTYAAHYEPVAVDDDVVVATGTSIYRKRPDGPVARVYDNCFVMHFDAHGRCRESTEYYLQRPG